ncbi:hypothetical protein LCGC14_0933960 [marine sediment metagenome]|uniref:Uncharacterized protein n=1 Tax=marine sediment metagenome TaxID=412755 RepID=A0A0F9RTK6_9ZZZZ
MYEFITTKKIPEILYFLIGVTLIPWFILIWITAFGIILAEKQKILIQMIFLIYGSIFELIFLTLLFINPELIGEITTSIDTEWSLFIVSYLVSIAIITGSLFAKKSLKSVNLEVRLRGKLLFMALIVWAFGSIIDTLFEVPIVRLLALIFLIGSSILFYFAFNLPNWLKKLVIKQS